MAKKILTYVFLVLLSCDALAEQEFTVATWNVNGAEQLSEDRIKQFVNYVSPDILLVDEVLGKEQVEDIARWAGLPHYAYSDFDADTINNPYNKLEVAILSRWPVSNIKEYEQVLETNPEVPESLLEAPDLPGLKHVNIGRGYLVAEIPDLNTTVIVTHLKSSRGKTGSQDYVNARKREVGAAAIAKTVANIIAADSQETVIVGGDFNVGERDTAKIGHSLTDDKNDGYDDTHALLTEGIVDGLQMRSLSKELDRSYAARDFGDTGPIDVLYVTGPKAAQFETASRTDNAFGSDHYAVYARHDENLQPVQPAISGILSAKSGSTSLMETQPSHDLLMASLWVQRAAEYQAITQQVYRSAARMLPEKIADPLWTAELEQRGAGDYSTLPPAVILDIDETVLDNSPFQTRLITGEAHADERFEADWQRWTDERRAELLEGAAGFLRTAQQLGVRVFFVTNRTASQEEATIQNLRAHGIYATDETVLTKFEQSGWDSSKVKRRAFVSERYRVVMIIGDDLNDFFSGVRGEEISLDSRKERLVPHLHMMSEGWFLLPNPMYGSWAKSLQENKASDLIH